MGLEIRITCQMGKPIRNLGASTIRKGEINRRHKNNKRWEDWSIPSQQGTQLPLIQDNEANQICQRYKAY